MRNHEIHHVILAVHIAASRRPGRPLCTSHGFRSETWQSGGNCECCGPKNEIEKCITKAPK
jgi:hypothetical protein